jgi:hypothetical protein
MEDNTTNNINANQETTEAVNTQTAAAAAAVDHSNAYVVDAPNRTVEVEYPDHKFKFEHAFVRAEPRDLIRYYLNAPSLKAVSESGTRYLGQPQAPAAELHDLTCNGLRRLSMTGQEQKVYALEDIRKMMQSAKAEGIAQYIGGYYEVELKSATGDMDDVLFGRATELEAIVKVRPSGKVEKTFKLFLNRPNDMSFARFTSQSQSPESIDPKRDTLLMEYIGEEALAEMTGGEDEGEKVSFQKVTQFVRSFMAIFDENFSGAENVTFEGDAYNPQKRNQFLATLDPVLKIQVAAALRNFI